jgi:hypothetical protein
MAACSAVAIPVDVAFTIYSGDFARLILDWFMQ